MSTGRRYSLTHVTRYAYEYDVMHAHHVVRMKPRADHGQRIESWVLTVRPGAVFRDDGVDSFGNAVSHVELRGAHRVLEVTSRSLLEVFPKERPETRGAWEEVACDVRQANPDEMAVVANYLFDSPLVRPHEHLREYAAESFSRGCPLLEAVEDLNRRIHDEFVYDPEATNVATPLAQVMREKRGVCQDFAHFAIGCLRSMGLPARYVSGYLETKPPQGRARLVGADASHAWASAWVPREGGGTWVDFDPTNGVLPDQQHIAVAWGRDFSDVSPLRGVVLGGGAHSVHVSVDTEPLGG